MTTTRAFGTKIWFLAVALAAGLASSTASADARTEYLVTMLEKGGNYRVRVQAATTLGKIRSQDAVPALVRALGDEHELVVISAAVALGQIGDSSVVGAMEKATQSPPSAAAKTQVEATLRVLRALSPEGDTTEVDSATPEFLIRIDAMGNSSDNQRSDLVEQLRKMVIRRVKREPGIVLQEPGMTDKAVKKKIKKEKLRAYILSGSLLKLEHNSNQMVAKIGLNVFSNPGYSLLMMPTAEGAVSVMAGPLARETERAAQERVMKAVAESLVQNVFQALRQNEDM